MKAICYWNPAKGNSRSMLEAFASGSGAEITNKLQLTDGIAVLWGVDKATLPLWNEIQRTKHQFIYVDNGYFRSKWQGGDHYRITVNAEQHSGVGSSNGERWKRLDIQIKPWRRDGKHILIACQSDFWHERHGHGSAAGFSANVTRALRQFTDRLIVSRMKPIGVHKEPPLSESLKDCWAVVTHSSMVALEAMLQGIPAFVLAKCALSPVSLSDLSKIETPVYPELEHWAAVLADNQWTLNEIRNGTAWKALNA
jgi:hypothetical protein